MPSKTLDLLHVMSLEAQSACPKSGSMLIQKNLFVPLQTLSDCIKIIPDINHSTYHKNIEIN